MRIREKGLWVKFLTCKHEILNLYRQHPYEKLSIVVLIVSTVG